MKFAGIFQDLEGNTGICYFKDAKAQNSEAAMLRYNQEEKDTQLISCRFAHGGFRAGAGRPGRFKVKCIAKKIPTPLAENFDEFLDSSQALIEIFKAYSDLAAEASPTSPRYEKLRQLLKDTSQPVEFLSKILNSIY